MNLNKHIHISRQRAACPRISVIIPVFNGADHIAQSITSALSQDVESEIIIVDDGSTDNSSFVARDFALRYPDKVFVVLQSNGGQGLARNTGLRMARGKYCCFLDADDAYLPGFFTVAYHILEEDPHRVAVVCQVALANLHRPVESWHMELIEASMPCNLMSRTAVVRNIGFPIDSAFRGMTGGEDCAFRQQLHASGPSVLIAKPYYQHRVRAGGHFDLFLNRTYMESGHVKFKYLTKEEKDGSLAKASRIFEEEIQHIRTNNFIRHFNSFQCDISDITGLQNVLHGFKDVISIEDALLIRSLVIHWPTKGDTVVFSNLDSNLCGWMRKWVGVKIRSQKKCSVDMMDADQCHHDFLSKIYFYENKTDLNDIALDSVRIVIITSDYIALVGLSLVISKMNAMPINSLLIWKREKTPDCPNEFIVQHADWADVLSTSGFHVICKIAISCRLPHEVNSDDKRHMHPQEAT